MKGSPAVAVALAHIDAWSPVSASQTLSCGAQSEASNCMQLRLITRCLKSVWLEPARQRASLPKVLLEGREVGTLPNSSSHAPETSPGRRLGRGRAWCPNPRG